MGRLLSTMTPLRRRPHLPWEISSCAGGDPQPAGSTSSSGAIHARAMFSFGGGSSLTSVVPDATPAPAAPPGTGTGANAQVLYVFNRGGVCLLYREWHRPLRTLDPTQDQKLMFGLLFSLRSFTAKIDPTTYYASLSPPTSTEFLDRTASGLEWITLLIVTTYKCALQCKPPVSCCLKNESNEWTINCCFTH